MAHNLALTASTGEIFGELLRVVAADPNDEHSKRSLRATAVRYSIGIQALLWLGIVGAVISATTRSPGQWFAPIPTVVAALMVTSIALVIARTIRSGGTGASRVLRGLLRDEPFIALLFVIACAAGALIVAACLTPALPLIAAVVPLMGILWFGGGLFGLLRT